MRKLLLAAAILILPTAANATQRVWISEFAAIPSVTGGAQAQIATLPSVTNQQVDTTGGVQSSAAFNTSTKYIRVVCEVQCAVKVGGTAASTDTLLPSYSPEYFGVSSGQTLSVIAAP